MADKRCGLCNHYKVNLSGQDDCRLLKKKVRSLDVACEQYDGGFSESGNISEKKSCAVEDC